MTETLKNARPGETYEGLKIQFFALITLLIRAEAKIEHIRKRTHKLSAQRVIELEAELESQKEMNAILTEELETSSGKIEQLRTLLKKLSDEGMCSVYGDDLIEEALKFP